MWRVRVKDALTGQTSQSAALTELVTFQPGLSSAAQFQGTELDFSGSEGTHCRGNDNI